ncbi:MAG: rubrerythrin family protein [Dehalococcoidales bacterium]|nr:rubrerythrin family protein [Dehalococcoidales bacterium]
MSRTDENLKIAFADESQTYIEYLAYTQKAIDEDMTEIAQIFREAAGAEVVHALTHLKTMNVINSTPENLREAAEAESLEVTSMYPKFIREAEEEGREDAAASFRIAFEREKHHRDMFREALRSLEKNRE